MDAEQLQASAERDQVWAGLRPLLPEIEQLAAGEFRDTERQRQMICLLARIVANELHYRAPSIESS